MISCIKFMAIAMLDLFVSLKMVNNRVYVIDIFDFALPSCESGRTAVMRNLSRRALLSGVSKLLYCTIVELNLL